MMKLAQTFPLLEIIASILVGFVFPTLRAEEENPAIDALLESYRKSREVSYVAEISHPAMPEFPKVNRAVFYRSFDDEGKLLLRTELYQGKKLLWAFVQNADGKYAIHPPSGQCARGGDFLRLYYLEELFNQPVQSELEKCSCLETACEFQGKTAKRFTIETPGRDRTLETPADEGYFMWVIGLWRRIPIQDLKEQHPFVREYTIDKATGVILALRKFNWHGKLIADVSLGKVNLNPDWRNYPECFATPGRIDYTVATTEQFVKLIATLPHSAQQTDNPRSRRENLSKERHWNLGLVKHLLLATGILLVGGALWLRHRSGV